MEAAAGLQQHTVACAKLDSENRASTSALAHDVCEAIPMTWTMHKFRQEEIKTFLERENLPAGMRESLETNDGVPIPRRSHGTGRTDVTSAWGDCSAKSRRNYPCDSLWRGWVHHIDRCGGLACGEKISSRLTIFARLETVYSTKMINLHSGGCRG